MKQIIKPYMLAMVLSIVSLVSFAQEKKSSIPRWLSDKGYWVIESNNKKPLDHIVRFYNNDNVLVYKETLAGVKLNPSRRKVKMKLKKALEASLITWERKREYSEETASVKAILD